jgi:hypothetical protein
MIGGLHLVANVSLHTGHAHREVPAFLDVRSFYLVPSPLH